MRQIVQSYKKVINHAPASRAASTILNFALSEGVDSVAAGQTGPTDVNVPTGAVIKYIEIQYVDVNLVAIASIRHVSIQKLHQGQSTINPALVGGNAQRNQVHMQQMFSVGQNQNSNHVYRFKIPKKFQRVREGDKWQFVVFGDSIHTSAVQAIYKFYR